MTNIEGLFELNHLVSFYDLSWKEFLIPLLSLLFGSKEELITNSFQSELCLMGHTSSYKANNRVGVGKFNHIPGKSQ